MADQRVALVVGGCGAIGGAVARRLEQAGAKVVLADLSHAAEQRVGENSPGILDAYAFFAVNVADEQSVESMFNALDKRFSKLDIVINCAGVSPRVAGRRPSVEETPHGVWERTLAINLTGTFLVCRAAIPRLRKNRWGRIVNIASLAGRTVGEATSGHYAASKSGVLGFSRVLAAELGPYGVTVNCVAPSRVDSAMAKTLTDAPAVDRRYIERTPVGRLARADDVAGAVMYLVSDEASFITGAVLDVTGGYFMP